MPTTTTTTRPTVRSRSSRIRTAAAGSLVGLLLGAGGAGMFIDDDAGAEPAVAVADRGRSTAARLAHEEEIARTWIREQMRAAVQRCILGPRTPEAAERCEDGFQLP